MIKINDLSSFNFFLDMTCVRCKHSSIRHKRFGCISCKNYAPSQVVLYYRAYKFPDELYYILNYNGILL